MEEIVKNMERFWSEAMRTLKEVIEKGASEVVDLPARELGLQPPDIPCSQDEENHDRVNDLFHRKIRIVCFWLLIMAIALFLKSLSFCLKLRIINFAI